VYFLFSEMQLSPGAYGYRISNPPGFLVVPIKASMEVSSVICVYYCRRNSLCSI